MVDQVQSGDVNVPRQLTNKQRRWLEPSPVRMAIMRRILDEHNNELTDYMTKHIVDVIKPVIVYTFHELMNGQQISSNSVQVLTNPANPAPFGYVPSSSTAQITFSIVGQIISPPPRLKIFQRAKIAGTTQTCGPTLTNKGNLPNPTQVNSGGSNGAMW